MSEKDRIQKLGQRLLDPSTQYYIDGLLDVVSSLVTDCDHPAIRRNKHIDGFINRFDQVAQSIQSERLNYSDFSLVKVIGQGAFGQVQLVRHRASNRVLAMKVLNKARMLDQTNSAFFWEEREIMARTTSDWLVKLFYAFMDKANLYLCMEYMPGGDLVNWLTNNEDISEDQATFYSAELVLGLEALHSMGFIHRDVKPENMLLDRGGHVKLADFGTCVRLGPEGFVQTSSAIGTPDYISPEVLFCQEKSGKIGPQCDWWALGVVLFEMLFGETAFYGDSLVVTYGRIMNFKTSLSIPDDIPVSDEAIDIIKSLLTDPETRLGSKGSHEVKSHPFYNRESWSWDNIRRCVPPFVPELTSEVDTCNFDDIEDESKSNKIHRDPPKIFNGENLAFAGFTFNRDCAIISSGGSDLVTPGSPLDKSALEDLHKEHEALQIENADLKSRAVTLEKRQALRDLELKDLERKLETVEHEKKRYTDQLKQAKHALSEERVKMEQKSLDCDRHIDDVNKAKKVGKQFEDQLDDERRSVNSLKSKLTDRDEMITSLEKDVENYTQRLREATQSKCELETELLELVERMEEERDVAKSLRDKQIVLEKKNRELENAHDQMLARQEQSQKEISLLSDTRRMLEGKVEDLTTELEQVRSSAVKSDSAEPATSSKREEDLEKQLTQAREDVKALNLARHDLEVKVSGVTSELQIKDKETSYLKEELEGEKSRLSENDEKLTTLTTFCQTQKQDLTKMKSSLSEIEGERNSLSSQLNDIRATMKRKEDDAKEMRDKLETAQLFSEAYKTQVADLEETNATLSEHQKELVMKYQLSKSELESAASNLKHLTIQLDEEKYAHQRVKEQLSEMERKVTVLEVDLKTTTQTHKCELEAREMTIGKMRDSEKNFITKIEEMTDEIRTHKEQKDQYSQDISKLSDQNLKLQREVDVEKKKVTSAVGKLDEVMSSGNFLRNKKMQKPKVSSEDYRQLEKKYKNLESSSIKKQKQHEEIVNALRKEASDRNASISELTENNRELQNKLDDSQRLVNELYQKLDNRSVHATAEDVPPSLAGDFGSLSCKALEGLVDINSKGRGRNKLMWMPHYAILKPFSVNFYISREDRESGSPATMELLLSQIVLVREVSQVDVIHAKAEDLPRIFQILYYPTELNPSHHPGGPAGGKHTAESSESGGTITWQGHTFQSMRFRTSTLCHACNRVCSDMFNPPPALECTSCHIKIHYEHVDKHQRIAACTDASKIQLVRVASAQDKQAWIARFTELKELLKSNPSGGGLDTSISSALSRVSPNISARSSFALPQ